MRRRLAVLPVLALALSCARADATNNLVLNPTFKTGVGFWTVSSGPGLSAGWASNEGATGSGSYHVATSAEMNVVVLSQCLNAHQAFQYTFGTYYKISSAFSGLPMGKVSVNWRSAPDCGGDSIRYDVTPSIPPSVDTWLDLTKTVVSPLGAKSVELFLIVVAPDATVGSALFDDVFLVPVGIPKGDANGDGTVDIGDVFHLLNFLFAGGPAPYAPVDVNSDSELDVADVFYLVNYLFANGQAPK